MNFQAEKRVPKTKPNAPPKEMKFRLRKKLTRKVRNPIKAVSMRVGLNSSIQMEGLKQRPQMAPPPKVLRRTLTLRRRCVIVSGRKIGLGLLQADIDSIACDWTVLLCPLLLRPANCYLAADYWIAWTFVC
jgi:hypothetical protein